MSPSRAREPSPAAGAELSTPSAERSALSAGGPPVPHAPKPTAEAVALFLDRLALARRYADLLAGPAVVQGLIGPRETPRLWDRHLVNCAVVAELLPNGARVVDVGSGAGLPGIALACLRPDITVDLVEPLQRRVAFLMHAAAVLDLSDRIRVVNGRAESPAVIAGVGHADWVTARAVAPLDRLLRWCLPLLVRGGSMLALKGARAEQEMASHLARTPTAHHYFLDLVRCGTESLAEPTSVIRVRRLR